MTSAEARSARIERPASLLLEWYDRHARTLPWRAKPGETADPYGVWLSEVMLQQTTVAAVKPYFERFLARWPTVYALADAELDDVLHAWQGLGYYARARNLHACARVVSEELDGRFPTTEAELRTLPGIGAYTGAAIAAIAFGERAVVVDGNVERVMARAFAVETPLPDAKPTLRDHAATLTPEDRAGDYAQAVMDLGATICTPRQPKCLTCPWNALCEARKTGQTETLPRRRRKAARPTRRGVAFWLINDNDDVFLRRRPEKGLLGGMIEVPSSAWSAEGSDEAEVIAAAPLATDWERLPGVVRHTFTHFHLELEVWAGIAPKGKAGGGFWAPIARLDEHALPTVMKKVVRHAKTHATRGFRT